MSANVSETGTVADIESTNPTRHFDRQHGYESGVKDADTDFMSSTKASSRMAADRTSSTSGNQPSEESNRPRPNAQLSESSKNGRQSSQSNLLQIPSEGSGARRPVETSIWDWETPLESVGESSSYYYEPVGELLHEQRDKQPARSEFSIPHAVQPSTSPWPFPSAAVGTNNNESEFAVPRRPSGVPPSIAGNKRKSLSDREGAGASTQPNQKRASRIMSDSGEEVASPTDGRPPAHSTRSHSGPSISRQQSDTEGSESRNRPAATDSDARSQSGTGTGAHTRTLEDPSIPMVLPPRKVFPIQIGDKLFRLSGASISSDAPSYFSQFFEEQLRQNEGADSVRTLYIDRDPATFEDISLHLQGYHVEPRDGPHFVKLFADAQFFSRKWNWIPSPVINHELTFIPLVVPRLTAQLFSSTIYIRIGESEFQIPRDLFSNPGDSPNYFSLGFSIFFTSPTEVFPGLSQRTLLRPPSILPPSVPNKSASTFADLMHILKGYPVKIRNEEHRQELLRDARYFHLKGLEQRLIPHEISYNLARKRKEILLRLEDIRQSGISFISDASGQSSTATSPATSETSNTPNGPGWIYYQRPYVDSESYCLIVEIAGEESTFLSIAPGSPTSPARIARATFHRQTLARVTSLFSVIANKMNLPITQPLGLMMMERGAGVASLPVSPGNTGVSEERVKVRIGTDADVTVDGQKWIVGEDENEDDDESGMDIDPSESSRSGAKRRRNDGDEDEGEDWVIKKAQWRLRVQPLSGGAQAGKTGMEVILGAVKIEAYSNERSRNAERGFLV